MKIKDIQKWEESFTKQKGIPQGEERAFKIALCKLMEEVGEVAEAILEENWDEILAEVSDVIIFACKIANVAEKFHVSDELSKVLRRKIKYVESKTYNKSKEKFNKPFSKEFK